MAAKKEELKTPEQVAQELNAIKWELRRAKLKTAWQITKAVLFPVIVVLGVIAFIVYGALFAILGESLKKITK